VVLELETEEGYPNRPQNPDHENIKHMLQLYTDTQNTKKTVSVISLKINSVNASFKSQMCLTHFLFQSLITLEGETRLKHLSKNSVETVIYREFTREGMKETSNVSSVSSIQTFERITN